MMTNNSNMLRRAFHREAGRGIGALIVLIVFAALPIRSLAQSSATSVATLWKTRATLAGKTVTVRGKVVKYNAEILGVNWIHLQDGTGKESDGTNDITVTSTAVAKVGESITVTGTVTVDKDLGSGYKYPVIIEKASIKR